MESIPFYALSDFNVVICLPLKLLEIGKEEEGEILNRAKMEDLLKQRFFYDMSFSIYGGIKNFFIPQLNFYK